MSALVPTLNAAGNAWWGLLVNAGWQAAIVGLVAIGIAAWWKRLPSSVRYGVLLIAVVKFLTPPVVALPFGVFSQLPSDIVAVSESKQDGGRSGLVTEKSHEQSVADDAHSRSATDLLQADPVDSVTDSDSAAGVHSSVNIRELIGQASSERSQEPDGDQVVAATASVSGRETGVTDEAKAKAAAPIGGSRVVSESTPGRLHWTALLMLFHVGGLVLFVAGAVIRLQQLRGLLKAADESETGQSSTTSLAQQLGLRRSPRLAVSSRLRIPFSYGVWHPLVVVPHHLLEELNDEEVNVVLLHELAHHRRRDPWAIWLQLLVSAVWWFHPVIWLLNRSLRDVREDCCDDLLISRKLVSGGTYCRTLLKVAASLNGSRLPFPALAASMAGGTHPLTDRLKRIMDDRIPRPRRTGLLAMAGLFCSAMFVLPGLNDAGEPVADGSSLSTAMADAPDDEVEQQDNQGVRRVTGRVLLEGKPLPEAGVWVTIKEIWDNRLDGPPVLGTARSNADGRFTVEIPERKIGRYLISSHTELAVWVYSGRCQLTRTLSRGLVPTDMRDISVQPPTSAGFLVRRDGNKPVKGVKAKLSAARFDRDLGSIPAPIRERMAVSMKEDGKLTFRGVSIDDIVTLTFESQELGHQIFSDYRRDQPMSRIITLSDSGSVTGQLVLPRGKRADLSKVRVRIGTVTDERHGDHPRLYGMAIVYPDRGGRFTIPAIAEGTIRCFITEPEGFPFRSSPPRGLVVSPGESARIRIAMRQAARVTGSILERGSKKPVVGARVHFQNNFQTFDARTGADGKFTTQLIPAEDYHVVLDVPGEYITQNVELFRDQPIPQGAETFEYKPIKLLRGRVVEGRVVDADGKPAGGIQIGADWDDPEEQFGSGAVHAVLNARRWVTTDAAGWFRIDRVHPTARATITPVRAGVRLGTSVILAKEDVEPVTLRMRDFDFVSLSGRIVDPRGVPVSGLQAWLYTNPTKPNDDDRRFLSVVAKAVDNGRFETDAVLPRRHAYLVIVKHEGKELGRSEWFLPTESNSTIVPPVVVKNPPKPTIPRPPKSPPIVASVIRTVVDSAGRPVEEAHVITWQMGSRRRQWTSRAGRVTLRGLPKSGAWLFVQKKGFRFHGELVRPASSAEPIVLRRTTEPPVRELRPRSALPISDEVRRLARRELLPFIMSLVSNRKADVQQFRVASLLRAAGRIDPELGAAILSGKLDQFPELEAIKDDLKLTWRDRTLMTPVIAGEIAKRDLPRARTVMEPLKADVRSIADFAGRLPVKERLPLLERAAELLPQLEGTHRVETGTFLAMKFRAAGSDKRALEVFRQVEKYAHDLPAVDRAGFSRGFLAWQIAPYDIPAALRLIKGETKQQSLDRYRSNIAHQIAGIDLEQAEKLLRQVKNVRQRETKTIRVCYRMAAVDFDRARRLVDQVSVSTPLRAFALAALAAGATQLKVEQRGTLIDQAYELLHEHVDEDRSNGRSIFTPQTVSFGMLGLVEIAAPDRANECVWRTLSLRKNWTIGNTMKALGRHGPNQEMRLADPVMGACFSRYDLDIARELTLTDGDETLDLGPRDAPYFLFGSLAILDPETAIRTVSKMPQETRRQLEDKLQAWTRVTDLLGTTTQHQWQYMMERQLNLWQPGKVDF